jgi:hypothetical protein
MPKAVRSSACMPPLQTATHNTRRAHMKKGGLLLHGKKDKKFNTAVVSIISWPEPQTFAFFRPGRSGQFLQREITRPPNLTV